MAQSDATPGATDPVPPFPTLATERLRLREIIDDDAPEMLAIQGDPDLMKWFGELIPDLPGALEVIEMLRSWRTLPDPGVRWGIERRDQPGLVGSCGLFGWRRRSGICVIGYELSHAAQGHGYMTEALTTAIRWGFENMQGLQRIEAQIHPDNAASQNVVTRQGFCYEGLSRSCAEWGGQRHDLQMWSLIREDWQNSSG